MVVIPRSVAELEFTRRSARDLLNVANDRDLPDTEHYAFGWGIVAPLVLKSSAGTAVPLRSALVLAVHSADEPSPDAEDLELEFDIDYGPGPDDYVAIIVTLGLFVTLHLPRVLAQQPATDVVFAMCNPTGRPLRIPYVAGVRTYWWAEGDVDSWVDPDRYYLTADTWHEQPNLKPA